MIVTCPPSALSSISPAISNTKFGEDADVIVVMLISDKFSDVSYVVFICKDSLSFNPRDNLGFVSPSILKLSLIFKPDLVLVGIAFSKPSSISSATNPLTLVFFKSISSIILIDLTTIDFSSFFPVGLSKVNSVLYHLDLK